MNSAGIARSVLVVATFLLGLSTNTATANILVFDNGVPPPSVVSLPVSDTSVALFNGDNYLHVDDFVLDSADTLTGLRWWGSNFFNPAENFLITLFEDDAGSPGTSVLNTLFSGVSSSRSPYTFNGFIALQEYEVSLPDINLMAQTRYWLGVQNVAQGDSGWGWAPSSNAGSALYRINGGDWIDRSTNLAFQLIGRTAVPLPGTALLVLAGLVAGSVLRRRSVQ